MARLVYGVSGEGSGHSSRARVVLEHLIRVGHEIKVVTYGRGLRHLGDDFDTFETEGLHITSVDNRVAPLKTLTNNLKSLPQGHKKLKRLRKEIFKTFKPHVVITDFEPMCAYLAHHYKLPLITVDNQHRLRYMRYNYPSHLRNERKLAVNIIRAMVPKPDVSLVTTFYSGELKNRRTFLFPPLIRSKVQQLVTKKRDHILVYLTSGFESFLDLLNFFPRERFIVYGQGAEGQKEHLTFKPQSIDGFLDDLANCKGVMATAGFTLMTEALYLKKPYLALPMAGQFEQAINGIFLEALACGINLQQINKESIGYFLYRLSEFEQELTRLPPYGNQPLLEKLNALVANDGKEAERFRKKRKELSRRPDKN